MYKRRGFAPVIILVVALAAAAALAGAGYYYEQKNKPAPEAAPIQTKATTKPALKPLLDQPVHFSSLRTALLQNKQVTCTAKSPDGVYSYITLGEPGMLKTSTSSKKDNSVVNISYRDNRTWTWTDGLGTGTYVDFSRLNRPGVQYEKMITETDSNTPDCVTGTLSRNQFTPPAEIKFTDNTIILKGSQVSTSGIPPDDQDKILTLTQILNYADTFYLKNGRYPKDLQEILDTWIFITQPDNILYTFNYSSSGDGQSCIITTKLSGGNTYSDHCSRAESF